MPAPQAKHQVRHGRAAFAPSPQSALEHRKARHVTLRRIAELQAGEETFELEQLECEREAWEVERGLQVRRRSRLGCKLLHVSGRAYPGRSAS